MKGDPDMAVDRQMPVLSSANIEDDSYSVKEKQDYFPV